jgi:hypothetical protein
MPYRPHFATVPFFGRRGRIALEHDTWSIGAQLDYGGWTGSPRNLQIESRLFQDRQTRVYSKFRRANANSDEYKKSVVKRLEVIDHCADDIILGGLGLCRSSHGLGLHVLLVHLVMAAISTFTPMKTLSHTAVQRAGSREELL